MIVRNILIDWTNSKERIPVDIQSPSQTKSVIYSIDSWHEDNSEHEYKIRTEVSKYNGKTKIILKYLEEENPSFEEGEVHWGETTIVINDDKSEIVKIEWRCSDTPDLMEEKEWELIEEGLIGNKKSKSVSQIIRKEQGKFRRRLIAADVKCVITGESTKEALEAAHIIPAKNKGSEILENGILLRADIHRLYDANYFSINSKGAIVIEKNNRLSKAYQDLLKNKKLNKKTLERVKRALKHV